MDLAAHFRVIAQNWVRILVISLVIAFAVLVVSSTQAKQYQSKATVVVTPGVVAGGQSQVQAAAALAQTFAQYVDTPSVMRQAARSSGLGIDASEAADRVSASQVGDIGFIEVKATGPSREDAEALGRAASQALVSTVQNQAAQALYADLLPIQFQRQQLQAQIDALPPNDPQRAPLQLQIDGLNQSERDRRAVPADRAGILSGARTGSNPVSPRPIRDALLAFVVSLVVVGELTVLAHYVGDRFSRSEDTADVSRLTGLPVLAKIPKGSGIEVVESFRVLRTNLMVLEGAGKPRTVAIVSANQSAGKTFTAVNLAQSAAGLDEKVVLVDADLRKPAVHERLGIPRAPGLSSVLQGGDLSTALSKVPDTPFLRVLPSGAPVQDASGVLGARAFRHVLDALRAVRLVVVDTPPSGLFADAMAVASQCDATIFVLDIKTSRRRQVRASLEALERAGANLIGVVVNRTSAPRRSSYYEA